MIYILIGARQRGKSYAVTDYFLHEFFENGVPFWWIRLTEAQTQKILKNNAEKLCDPDLVRRYKLDLITKGDGVYQVTKRSAPDKNGKTKVLETKLMCRVLPLSTFYKDKGALYDKDFLKDPKMRYHIAIDEFQPEKGEKRTFDLLYSLVNQLETIVRNTKERTKVFFMGNTLQEASDLLCALNFLPEGTGIYKLKRKRTVIEVIENSEAYKEMRKGSLADILMPNASTFTNKQTVDNALVDKSPLIAPNYIIKFTKDPKDWFTV